MIFKVRIEIIIEKKNIIYILLVLFGAGGGVDDLDGVLCVDWDLESGNDGRDGHREGLLAKEVNKGGLAGALCADHNNLHGFFF
jgi:hypothetical protein